MNKIVKHTVLFVSFFFLFSFIQGQNIIFSKADFIKGNGIDKVSDLHIDAENNLYLIGTFEKNGTVAGIEMQKQEHQSLFLAKYNSEGTLQYTKQFGGDGDITAHALTSDSRNNLYISGTFRKSCRFGDKEIKSARWQNNFIVKLSPDGSIMQVKKIDAAGKDEKTYLLCDADDNLYYTGSFFNTMTIDNKEIESTSGSDIFIAKFDNNLNLKNLNVIHGKNKDVLKGIAVSDDNRVFITGYFTDNIDINGKIYPSNGRKDIFWAEINDNSEANEGYEFVKQFKQFGNYYDDFPADIKIHNNKLYLTGSFTSEVKFGKDQLKSKGISDVFVSIFKLNGKEILALSFGGQANDYARSLVISAKGNVYVTGNFRESIEQNGKSIKTNGHQSDNFIAVINEKGDLREIKSFGGKDNDFPVKTVIDKQNILYHTGTFRTDFKFGSRKTSETNKTKNNIFLAELYDCDNTELNLGDDIEVCGNKFTLNPDINFTTYQWSNGSTEKETNIFKSGTYTLTVTDRFGCTASDAVNIILNEIPTVDLGEDRIILAGQTVTIDAGAGFENYFWTSSDSLQNFKTSGQQLIINTQNITEGTYGYSLTVTDFNGCSCKDRIQLTVLNTENQLDLNAFSAKVVPNPNMGKFTVYITNVNKKEKVRYEIYSPAGKLIYKNEGTKNTDVKEITVNNAAQGSYLLKIINGTAILNKVIIISEK